MCRALWWQPQQLSPSGRFCAPRILAIFGTRDTDKIGHAKQVFGQRAHDSGRVAKQKPEDQRSGALMLCFLSVRVCAAAGWLLNSGADRQSRHGPVAITVAVDRLSSMITESNSRASRLYTVNPVQYLPPPFNTSNIIIIILRLQGRLFPLTRIHPLLRKQQQQHPPHRGREKRTEFTPFPSRGYSTYLRGYPTRAQNSIILYVTSQDSLASFSTPGGGSSSSSQVVSRSLFKHLFVKFLTCHLL